MGNDAKRDFSKNLFIRESSQLQECFDPERLSRDFSGCRFERDIRLQIGTRQQLSRRMSLATLSKPGTWMTGQ